MTVFSRSFIRKRVISLATTASVAATSLAVLAPWQRPLSVKPTGDVDRDFVATMVPHHQGAIDMAKAELRHGHNAQLRRLAQEIVVTQQQEISVMQLALRNRLPASVASPAKPALAFNPSAMSHDAMAMSDDAIAHH